MVLTRALALAAAFSVAAASCADNGSSSGRPDTGPSSPASAQPTSSHAAQAAGGEVLTLPLDAYVGTNEQRVLLDRATALLVQRCMKEKGFDYQPPEVRPRPLVRRQPYGIVDAAQASRYGYRDPNLLGGGKTFTTERPPDAYLIALQGFARPPASGAPPSGGCLQEADDRIIGGATTVDLELLGRLGEEAALKTAADPRVAAAEEAWSACMAARGFRYRKPSEPLSAPWPPTPSATEIATAKADVACKHEVALPRIWVEVEAGFQQELVDRHAAQLVEVKRVLDERLARAQAVLSGDG